MKKESVKSAILTALIIISLLLTWNMWTYQPTLFDAKKETDVYEVMPITNTIKKYYEVIKPQQLFIHDGENHFSTMDASHSNDLWMKMQSWEYSDLESGVETFSSGENLKEIQKNSIELRFLNEIPMKTFQAMLEWDADTENVQFDRIYLKAGETGGIQSVYFVSYDKMRYVESSVNNNSEATQKVKQLFNDRNNLEKYYSFNISEGKEIFLPVNEPKMVKHQYKVEEIAGSRFRDALFSNSSVIKQDSITSKNSYTDAISLLDIYPEQHRVYYVNPAVDDSVPLEASTLVDQSIKFLNQHGGWTDEYMLFDIDDKENKISYIMQIHSIPVIPFDEYPQTMIIQKWGQNEAASYERPSYRIDFEINSNNEIMLMSGKKVEELLKANNDIDKEDISNIYIAYQLENVENQGIVNVTPVWCIEMNNGKLKTFKDEIVQSGGNANGME